MTDVTAARSYRPGQWFGIFGEHAEVLLPPSEKARVGTLWALVDDGAGFDVVLDALISEGLRDLPGFVLVATFDGETKVVIRGEARAWFTTGDGTVEVAGTDLTTWAERSFTGVTATRLVVGPQGEEVAEGGPLPIDNGLVRVSEVVAPIESSAPAAAPEPVPVPVPGPTPEPEAEPTPEPEPESEPSPESVPEPVLPPTPPPPSPLGAPSGSPPIEHDGNTQTGLIAEPDPGEANVDAEASPAVSRPVARLVFSSGENLEVDRAVLVGRAPEARRFTSGDQPQLVTVPSPAHEISSTHLEIRPGSGADHGSAVVTDLGSTNGTVLVQPGLPPEDLQAGIAVQLIPGAIIDLGDGVTIQVINL